MRLITLLVCSLYSLGVFGSLVGGGNLTLGASKDQDAENFGVAGRYDINLLGAKQYAHFSSQFQLGSDKGRSSVATLIHDYQYEQSYLQSYGILQQQFFSPAASWNTTVSSRQEFKNETDDATGETRTDFNDKDHNWGITTGPSFTIDRNWPISVQVSALLSKQSVTEIESDDREVTIDFQKDISKFSQMAISGLRTCTDYKDAENEDSCRNELTAYISSKKKYSQYKIEYGVANQNDTETEIYEVTLEHELNSAASIQVLAYQSIYRLNQQESDQLDLTTTGYNSVQKGESLQYLYEWGRHKLDMRFRQVESSINGASPIEAMNTSFFYGVKTSSRLCRSCELELGYEKSKFESGDKLEKGSLSVKKNHSKRIRTAMSVNNTKQEDNVDVWSVSFFLTYTGKLSKLGTR